MTSFPTSQMERHMQTGIQIGILALLAWNFTTVQNMEVTIGRLEEKVIAQSSTIVLLSKLSDDRYRAKDAARDFVIRDRAILALEARVLHIEDVLITKEDK